MLTVDKSAQRVLNMGMLKTRWLNCQDCAFSRSRTSVVFGGGAHDAAIMVISPQPGWQDDLSSYPCSGMDGEILVEALMSVGLTPTDVFVTHLVKCCPPKVGDRRVTPDKEHLNPCRPLLLSQMEQVQPAILVLQGRLVNNELLGENRPLAQYIGHFRQLGHNCIAVTVYNPAGFFGERTGFKKSYLEHWRQIAYRLNLLGRIWRPDAPVFQRGWSINDPTTH